MIALSLCLALPLLAPSAELQRTGRVEAKPGPGVVDPIVGERIVWYGSLKQGQAIAAETERPILLISAAPSCRGVPGVW